MSDGEGGVHEHLEFFIDPTASAQAFLIEFILEGYSDQTLSSTNGWSSENLSLSFLTMVWMRHPLTQVSIGVPIPAAWLF